jgi:hypothetical protein
MDGMVEFQQAFQDFFPGSRGDGVAGAVVFRQVIHLKKIIGQVDVRPAVCFEHGFIHFPVQAAEF